VAHPRQLEAKGAIVVTQEGGNQVRRGAATVYRIPTPPKRSKGDTTDALKGDTPDTLRETDSGTDRGDKSGSKGDISGTKGDISGQIRVTPVSGHQVNTPGPIHHSAHEFAGPPATQISQRNPGQDDTNLEDENDNYDLASIDEWLREQLGYLEPGEETLADAMLANGAHPNAVRNTINKQRLGGTFDDVNQDQKRLDEDPRCKTCGISMSRHGQWMAETGATHAFADTAI
jgi:hypothetical protein